MTNEQKEVNELLENNGYDIDNMQYTIFAGFGAETIIGVSEDGRLFS